jgi:predicted TPR repeat methyltransferase
LSSRVHATSGDLIADRRYEWARRLIDDADFEGAASLLTQVLELAPDYATAWFALGDAREKLGDRAAAIAAFERAQSADPRDAHGATLRLARLRGVPPTAMPQGYLQSLYDGYAPAFETSLVGRLGYRGPQLLLDAVTRAAGQQVLRFASVLDLGCGTGLTGAAFRPFAGRLTGVDLSPGMLARARGKGIYDRLIENEALAFLRAETATYDLILAADVFIYVHDIAELIAYAAGLLAPGGLIAFTVETHDGDSVILRDTLRYAHAPAHVREALKAARLKLVSLDSATARSEKGVPVPGLVVVARR